MSNEKFTPMKKNTFFLKRAMAKHYGSKCIYCGKELMYREMTIDHLWPDKDEEYFNDEDMQEYRKELEERGFVKDSLENYLICCIVCNNNKNNYSLGVPNLRYFYSYTFRKRDKILQELEKLQLNKSPRTNNGEEAAGNDILLQNLQDGNKSKILIDLTYEKTILNSGGKSFYQWGKKDAQISAFMPLNFEGELCCNIILKKMYNVGVHYTMGEKDMKDYLFAGCGLELEEKPWCMISGKDEERGNNFISLPKIRIEATRSEIESLSEIIDDLCIEYDVLQDNIRNYLGINYFDADKIKEVRILIVSKRIWDKIVKFSSFHTCDRENTKWNIFGLNPARGMIHIGVNDYELSENNKARILARYEAKYEITDWVEIYWKPGYEKLSEIKIDNFDNKIKWKADYSHDWLMEELIPHILFEELSVGEKLIYKNYKNKAFMKKFISNNREIISCKKSK